jgi:hypothetical protein
MLHGNILGMTAELSTSFDGRKSSRAEVRIGAGLRQRGASSVTVHILDLSTTGFRATTHLQLMEGSDIWVKLPGLESLHSRVVWSRGHLLGCEFLKPLHPAVLQMIVRSHRGH